MRLLVLGLAAVAITLAAVPASAQFIYMDVNGDGICNSSDVLSSSVTSIDLYIDTNSNADGSTALCPSGEDLTINSYTFILQSTGGVDYGTWTDNMGFTVNLGGTESGNDYWIGLGSGTAQAPGTYKIGTLGVSVTGSPALRFGRTTTIDPVALTSFGSQCTGIDFDNTLKLGSDFEDACVVGTFTATTATTWGKIKEMYSH